MTHSVENDAGLEPVQIFAEGSFTAGTLTWGWQCFRCRAEETGFGSATTAGEGRDHHAAFECVFPPAETEQDETPCIAPPGNLCLDTGCWDADRCIATRPIPPGKPCETCGGSGQIDTTPRNARHPALESDAPCPTCDGTGETR